MLQWMNDLYPVLLIFIAEMMSYGIEYPLVSVGQLSWIWPSQDLAHSQPTVEEGMLERQPW